MVPEPGFVLHDRPADLKGMLDKADLGAGTWSIMTEKGSYSGKDKTGGPSHSRPQAWRRIPISCMEEIENRQSHGARAAHALPPPNMSLFERRNVKIWGLSADIATLNKKHLAQFVPAEHWKDIHPIWRVMNKRLSLIFGDCPYFPVFIKRVGGTWREWTKSGCLVSFFTLVGAFMLSLNMIGAATETGDVL